MKSVLKISLRVFISLSVLTLGVTSHFLFNQYKANVKNIESTTTSYSYNIDEDSEISMYSTYHG